MKPKKPYGMSDDWFGCLIGIAIILLIELSVRILG